VVFRDEETVETTAAVLSRESGTNSLTCEVMWFYPEVMSQNTFLFHHFVFWWKNTLKLHKFSDLLSSRIAHSIKW
jgi:hypothetical protein